jgi:hypothetical protein
MQKFITLTSLKVFFRELKRYIALAIRQQLSVTYSELVDLRNAGKLVAGRLYRITDYVTTVFSASGNERSVGHPFDVIVRATSETELSEHAFAAKHEGDEYFTSANLNAWKIWYSLDNNLQKYAWADVENGKGVIYRMIDEWDNDVPYDFKNIQFKRFKVVDESPNGELADLDGRYLAWGEGAPHMLSVVQDDFVWSYTLAIEGVWDIDYSLNGEMEPLNEDKEYWNQCHKPNCARNSIAVYTILNVIDDVFYKAAALNDIVCLSQEMDGVYGECLNCHIDIGNCKQTLHSSPEDIEIGSNSYENIVSGFRVKLPSKSCYNTSGNDCDGNTFGNGCDNNTYGNDCDGNTFGNSCWDNTFGNGCYRNTFGNGCNDNTYGNDCQYITFGNNIINGTVQNGVKYVKVNGSSNSSSPIKNFVILSGTCGQSADKPLVINFEPNKNATQYAGLNSQGELVIWCPADAV